MAIINHKHMRLLRSFGQDGLQQQMDPQQREMLWRVSCQQSRLPYVPLEEAVKEWRAFVQAQSRESGIAITAEYDPRFCSIGITYRRIVFAAHTSTTKALLKKLLAIYRRCFDDYETFLAKLVELCPPPSKKNKS